MSIILTEVNILIQERICQKHIKCDDKNIFSGMTGFVDCTDVHISALKKEIQHLYINKKKVNSA